MQGALGGDHSGLAGPLQDEEGFRRLGNKPQPDHRPHGTIPTPQLQCEYHILFRHAGQCRSNETTLTGTGGLSERDQIDDSHVFRRLGLKREHVKVDESHDDIILPQQECLAHRASTQVMQECLWGPTNAEYVR